MEELREGIESAHTHEELASRMAILYATCRLAPAETSETPIRWMVSGPDRNVPVGTGVATEGAWSAFRPAHCTPANKEMEDAVISYFKMVEHQFKTGRLSTHTYQTVIALRKLAVGDKTWDIYKNNAHPQKDSYWRARVPMEPGSSIFEPHNALKKVLAIALQYDSLGD